MSDQALHALQAQLRGDVLLGWGRKTDLYLPLRELHETSVHIVGAAGYGKSFYLRHLIDQFIAHRQVFGVIDPHRELFEYALWRLRRAGVSPERIVPLDPGDKTFSLGFNPLACGIADPGETVSVVLDSFLKAWGAKSFDETPRLEGILRLVFRLLIAGQLTLLESYELLAVDNGPLRRMLRERVGDQLVRRDWDEYEKLNRPEKLAVFESSRNRLRRVLQAPSLRWMLAQTGTTLDFRNVLDEGKYLLANLGSVSAPETQRLLGALLINGLFHAAKQRNSRRRRDWFLICDEFGEFATRDVANSLDQLRKFGVHLILAHQRLGQLQREDPDVLSAVMTNAKIKVVFGGLQRPEAEVLAKELYTGQVRGDRIKHIAVQTKYRPIFDTFNVESETYGESHSESENESSSRGSGTGVTSNEAQSYDAERENRGRNESRGESRSDASSESRGRSRSGGTSNSHSSSRVPITRHEEFQEETGRQYWSLEEEWEHRIASTHGLHKFRALVRAYNGPVHHVESPYVQREQLDERLERFRQHVLRQCPHIKAIELVELEIEERQKMIAEAVESHAKTNSTKSFRE
jgi:hypothetical protein